MAKFSKTSVVKQKHSGILIQKNVVMSNALVQAAQGLNLSQKRILFIAIAKMGGKIDSSGFIKITALEFAQSYGLAQNLAYTQLKTASEAFFNCYVTLRQPEGNGTLVGRFRWLDAYKYHDDFGYVSISFSKHVIPYLIDLEQQFTKYKLKQACALRSVYSWRLLELIQQQSSGWLQIKTDDLHHAFESPKSQRANFGKFRTQVLEPAIKELSEKDGWVINYTPIKEGRRVASIRFEFEKDKQERLSF